MRYRCPLWFVLLSPLLAWADGQPLPADLPPLERVMEVLDGHPSVRQAQAALRSAQAEHRLLKAGEHAYGLSLTGQRRNVSGGPDYNEWEVGFARGLRLPNKARLDDEIGSQGVQAAAEKVGDARHELARQILASWYAARQAMVEADLWREQVGVLAELDRITGLRLQRGDAARLDSLLSGAALSQGRSQLGQAESRVLSVTAELRARYPELPVPAAAAAEPVLPAGDLEEWLQHALEHNHELLAVQRALDQGRLKLRRAEANAMPDPTVGLFYANEADGEEKLLGISVSVALPGEAGRATADVKRAESEMLAEEEARTQRRLRAETTANWQRAQSSVASHAQLQAAAAAVGEHAALARRAYELGELDLTETLLARRNALETRLAAEQARLGANEAIARLLLDTHRLWPLGGDEEAHH